MNGEKDRGTKKTTLLSTHLGNLVSIFLSLNATRNIILKTFEFNPKLTLSISYCWFMVTLQMQPVIPWVGPVQHKVHFHTSVCRAGLDFKSPNHPCHTTSQHLC